MEVGPSWTVAELERAREYHRRQMWADGGDAFRVIDSVSPLAIDDLARLIECTYILGRGDEAASLLQRVYQVHVNAGDIGNAVRCAFYLWHVSAVKGEFARAGGWIARGWRLAQTQPECAEVGYKLIPDAERRFGELDFAGAFDAAGRAVDLGNRCGDPDLVAVAAHIQGRARIKQGGSERVWHCSTRPWWGVTAGETSAGITSWVCCITSSSMPTICRHWPSSGLRCWVGRSFLSGSRKSSSAPMRPHRLGSASCP